MSKGKIFFFILLAVIFLISVAGLWLWQRNVFSKEKVKIEILAPSEIQVGGEINYLVKIKNNSDVLLESPELIFEYPKNAVPDKENSTSTIQKLSDFYPGQELSFTYKCRVFGKQDDIITANVWVTYKPKNIKASFESRTQQTAKITSANLTFEIDAPLKAEQGEEIEVAVNYFSNIDYTLSNLHLRVEYPLGFQFVSAVPKALDTNEWNLPILTQANGGRVKIKGRLSGQLGEQPLFKAQLGVLLNNNFIILKEATAYLELSEASVYLSQTVNNQMNYTAKPGELLHYEIFFKNIGQKALQNKFLLIKLQSDLFDIATISPGLGDVSGNNIMFDSKNVSYLALLLAMEEGKVDFWVRVKDNISGVEPILTNVVSLAGVEKTFTNKVSGGLGFSQKAYFENEVFDNQGPMPLQAGATTQFTMVWYIKNGFNVLNNVKVKALLPNNVNLTGEFIPDTAGFTFDSVSREIVWQVGNLSANSQASLAFQIEIMPASSGGALLIRQAELSGLDGFTNNAISEKSPAVYSSGLSD